jgi:hypothetical protein
MATICVPMQGIFLLFIFLIDPSLYSAIRTARARWKERRPLCDEEHAMTARNRREHLRRSPKDPQDYLSADFDWTGHDIQRPAASRTSSHARSRSCSRSRSASEASSNRSYSSRCSESPDTRHDEIIRSPSSAMISSPTYTDTPPIIASDSTSTAHSASNADTTLHSNSYSNSNSTSNSNPNPSHSRSLRLSFGDAFRRKSISIFALDSPDENAIPAFEHSISPRQTGEDDRGEFRRM